MVKLLRAPDAAAFEASDILILSFRERWVQLTVENVSLAACLP